MEKIIDKIKNQLEQNGKIKIKVRLNRPKFKILEKENSFYIEITSQPEKNKANQEIIKKLTKLIGKQIIISSGLKSKEKTIAIAIKS